MSRVNDARTTTAASLAAAQATTPGGSFPAGGVTLRRTATSTVDDVRSSQMLLATKADGKHMPVDRSGPIRIVFPDSSSLGRNPDLWIWSVSSMKGRLGPWTTSASCAGGAARSSSPSGACWSSSRWSSRC